MNAKVSNKKWNLHLQAREYVLSTEEILIQMQLILLLHKINPISQNP